MRKAANDKAREDRVVAREYWKKNLKKESVNLHIVPRIANIVDMPYFIGRLRSDHGTHVAKLKLLAQPMMCILLNFKKFLLHLCKEIPLHNITVNQHSMIGIC